MSIKYVPGRPLEVAEINEIPDLNIASLNEEVKFDSTFIGERGLLKNLWSDHFCEVIIMKNHVIYCHVYTPFDGSDHMLATDDYTALLLGRRLSVPMYCNIDNQDVFDTLVTDFMETFGVRQ